MAKDAVYTNGVIAAKETSLLGEKLLKLCETDAQDAFRAIAESGFGKGAEAESAFDYEKLLAADERDLDAFVREYAPANAELGYFLAPRDFHNAKAAFKAKTSGEDANKLLAPNGLVAAEGILKCVEENNFSALYDGLKEVCETAAELLNGENEVSGADLGILFERAKYAYLLTACKRNKFLKKIIVKKADMTDILTAFRSQTYEYALNNALSCGNLKAEQIEALFCGDSERAVYAFEKTPYKDFVKECFAAKENGQPFTEAEQIIDNLETDELAAHKYELKKSQPFLYYVLRRRAENANVRILLICLMAGVGEAEIKSRLGAV